MEKSSADARTPLNLGCLTLSAMCVLLAGCGNYASKPFDLAQSQPSHDIGGIPFTLNKPQFTITRVPAGNGSFETYQTKVDYIPDPTQRYVIRMTPMLTANTDWTVGYDENGSLSDTNGKATDQTVPILLSLAKLAGSVAALDSGATVQTLQLHQADDAMLKNLNGSSPQLYDYSDHRLVNISRIEADSVKKRWQTLLGQLLTLAEINQIKMFTYQNLDEKRLLMTALYLFPPRVPDELTKIMQGADTDLHALGNRMQQDLDRLDLTDVEKVRTDLVAERTKLYAGPTDLDQDKLAANHVKLEVVKAVEKNLKEAPRELLIALTALSPEDWQKKEVDSLNQQIAVRELDDRVQSNPGSQPTASDDVEANDAELRKLRRKKAEVLGLLSEFDQLQQLRARALSGKGGPKDQATMDALEKRLNDAEAALVPAKTVPKTDDPIIATYLQNYSGDISGKAITDYWVAHQEKRRPMYVVVLSPVLSPPTAGANGPGNGQSTGSGNLPSTPAEPVVPPKTGSP